MRKQARTARARFRERSFFQENRRERKEDGTAAAREHAGKAGRGPGCSDPRAAGGKRRRASRLPDGHGTEKFFRRVFSRGERREGTGAEG